MRSGPTMVMILEPLTIAAWKKGAHQLSAVVVGSWLKERETEVK